MDLTELHDKLQRMYESVEEATERDLTNVRAHHTPHGNWVKVTYDIQGGWSPTKIKRAAFGIIRDIADLEDYVRAAAKLSGHDPEIVTAIIKQSFELALIIDLCNLDKHTNHNRKTWSGKKPRLRNISRVVSVSGTVRDGPRIGLQLGPEGVSAYGGKGAVVVSADIVGVGGEELSTLLYAQAKAIETWESQLNQFGIVV